MGRRQALAWVLPTAVLLCGLVACERWGPGWRRLDLSRVPIVRTFVTVAVQDVLNFDTLKSIFRSERGSQDPVDEVETNDSAESIQVVRVGDGENPCVAICRQARFDSRSYTLPQLAIYSVRDDGTLRQALAVTGHRMRFVHAISVDLDGDGRSELVAQWHCGGSGGYGYSTIVSRRNGRFHAFTTDRLSIYSVRIQRLKEDRCLRTGRGVTRNDYIPVLYRWNGVRVVPAPFAARKRYYDRISRRAVREVAVLKANPQASLARIAELEESAAAVAWLTNHPGWDARRIERAVARCSGREGCRH